MKAIQEIREILTRKRILGFILALVCFIAICSPQGIINYKSGHAGLFPHDSEDAYGGHPVSWSMWGTFLQKGMVLWPHFIGDDQTRSMKTQLFEKDELIHPAQAMDIYANSPIETAVTLCKKLLTMFDYKNNVNYGTEIPWRETKGLVFSFFNYLVLLTGLYMLIKKQSVSSKGQILIWLIFLGTVAFNMAGHMEWRSSMTFYIILCMLFSYVFLGEAIRDNENYKSLCSPGLYRFVAYGELLCFGISMTLWA